MFRGVVFSLTAAGVAGVLALAVRPGPVQSQPQPAPVVVAKAAELVPAEPSATVKTAGSRVTAVTVYPNSALVSREVDVPAGTGVQELVVTPLPPQTVNSSLYTEGLDGIRVLATRFRTRQLREDTREDVRKLQDELESLRTQREKLDADIKAVQANMLLLNKMENFTASTTAPPSDKGALNSESAIALVKYIMENRLERAKELTGLQQQVRLNQEKAEFAQRKLTEMSAGSSRMEQDAVIVVDKTNAAAGKVRLNYLVDAAAWRPQYKLRAGKTDKDTVQLEYLAAIAQHTGEDWTGVKLVLSTAAPTLNAAPPDLQVLQVTTVAKGTPAAVAHHPSGMELEMQVRNLRTQAQKDINEKKQASGAGLFNTAAALDQSWELLNPEAAVKRGCALAVREGPTVTYHLNTKLTVPSRNDEQVIEVARIDMQPDYYYKAVPVLTSHVYRQADLTNKSGIVLLPGEATMYIGTDFVGQMTVPLVAIGEQFTVGFGVDPQLQITRAMTDRSKTTQGGNQVLRYEYRILLSSYKPEKVKVQVWDRLPHPENDTVGVSLIHTAPDVSKDALYLREQRVNNLLRWDVTVEPAQNGEKAMAINYEFKIDLDRQMSLGSFQTAGGASLPPTTRSEAVHMAPLAALPNLPAPGTPMDQKIKAAMAKLTPEDRKLAETQIFCAVDHDSPLGSMGPVLKVMCKGKPVFLCCKGCEKEAQQKPDEALKMLDQLLVKMGRK